jgi:hypothetical protein
MHEHPSSHGQSGPQGQSSQQPHPSRGVAAFAARSESSRLAVRLQQEVFVVFMRVSFEFRQASSPG